MGGSTVAQFLFEAYQTNLTQAVTTTATTILGAVAATAQGALLLYILIAGKNMMFGELSAGAGVTRMVRALIIFTLLTATNYQTFIATPITTTVPNFISNTVTGTQGLAGAQGWDALMNQVSNATAQARSQALGLTYIGDRAIIWITGILAKLTILGCLFIWMLASATADFLMPLGGVILPFYLFDATRSFAERWVGKIISLFLVMIVTMMLGQIVVFQDAQYLQKFSTNIAARPADTGFNMNPDVENPLIGPTTAGQASGSTINVDSAIDTLGNVLGVFVFGLFELVVATGIALYIGGSSGFSAAPAFNAAMNAGRLLVRK